MTQATPNPGSRPNVTPITSGNGFHCSVRPVQNRGALVMDAFANAAARIGFGSTNLLEGTAYPLTRLSWNYQLLTSLYRGNWVARSVIETIPDDMMKHWVDIHTQQKPEQLKAFDRAITKSATKAKLLEALQWGRLYGGAGAVIIVDGHQNRLEEPLELEDVALGSYRGLITFDRWSGIVPDTAHMIMDFSQPDFGLPEYYNISAASARGALTKKVHHTRVLRFPGRNLPQWEKQAEMYWGLSEVEIIWDALRMHDNSQWNIASLMFIANIMVMKSGTENMAQLLATAPGAQQQRIYNMLAAQRHLMSNQGMMVLDKDGSLENHQLSFAGLAEIWEKMMLIVSAASQIPMSRLYGQTRTGLGQANEGDEHNYYEVVATKQNRELRPRLDKLFAVIATSTWGELPDDFEFTFKALNSPTEKERKDLGKQNAEAINTVYVSGIIGRKTALRELKQQSDESGLFSNISDEMIAAASDDVTPNMGELGGAEKDPWGSDKPDEGKEASAALQGHGLTVIKGGKAQDAEGTERGNEQMDFAGFPVTVEYRKGVRRTLLNPSGNIVYDRVMQYDYGFLRDTTGVDGDEVDVILGPYENSPKAFPIVMIDLGPDIDKREDEFKICLGFMSEAEAVEAFLTMYPKSFLGPVSELSVRGFRKELAADAYAELAGELVS